ncbi:hypothetical protein [Streptomyces vinaceus]|uniref:hypothetical protein n=1 Tax=Streptomyces vinaceus TaxID=1960 RepID=UPI003821ECC7
MSGYGGGGYSGPVGGAGGQPPPGWAGRGSPVPPQPHPYAWAPPPGAEPSRGRKILRGLYNPFCATTTG